MIRIYFHEKNVCNVTSGLDLDFVFKKNVSSEDCSFVKKTISSFALIIRFLDSFNNLGTNQLDICIDDDKNHPSIFIGGIRQHLSGLMILLENIPNYCVTFNYHSGHGSEVEIISFA